MNSHRLKKASGLIPDGAQTGSACANCGCVIEIHAILAKTCTSVVCPGRFNGKPCTGFKLIGSAITTSNKSGGTV